MHTSRLTRAPGGSYWFKRLSPHHLRCRPTPDFILANPDEGRRQVGRIIIYEFPFGGCYEYSAILADEHSSWDRQSPDWRLAHRQSGDWRSRFWVHERSSFGRYGIFVDSRSGVARVRSGSFGFFFLDRWRAGIWSEGKTRNGIRG